jgi:hypothetical protein
MKQAAVEWLIEQRNRLNRRLAQLATLGVL